MLFEYDDRCPSSILEYAKKLENKTFGEILEEYKKSPIKRYINPFDIDSQLITEEDAEYNVNENAKGELGNFLEKYYFGYKQNSKQEADFSKAGIELKQTCIDMKKNGEYTAGERLSITNISLEGPIETDFYKSHVWEKISHILLVHYLRDKSKKRLDYQIKYVNLFTPPAEDLRIIINDFNKINSKIIQGCAHELSESDTLYLGACTKGVTALKSIQPQFYGQHIPAKKRNYCFKRSYMDYVLHAYILRNQQDFEPILKECEELNEISFEDYVLNKINKHIGMSVKELCYMYNREYNNNKAQWIDLAYRMLGIKGNQAEEFIKANIVVKAIRIGENDLIKESMSFPPFEFIDFVNEEWENSEIFNYFTETRFLFVIFKKADSDYHLLVAQLWSMPYNDLNITVRRGWIKIQECIKNDVKFTVDSNRVINNLPKKKENPIIHIRPHAKKAAYKLHNGYVRGDLKDASMLPNGEWMTKHSFWINNTYILSQLKSIK